MNFFKLLVKSADVVHFPVLAPGTLSSSTLWSEFLEEKRRSKQSVGYLKDLKFVFDAVPPPHRANSPLQAKNLTGIGLQTCCNKNKSCWALEHFYLIKRKGQKAVNQAFVSNFSCSLRMSSFSLSFRYSFKFMRSCQRLRSQFPSLVWLSNSAVCSRFWAAPLNKDTVSLTFHLLVHFTFDNILWHFVYKNTGLAAFLNQEFGVGEDLHGFLQSSFYWPSWHAAWHVEWWSLLISSSCRSGFPTLLLTPICFIH